MGEGFSPVRQKCQQIQLRAVPLLTGPIPALLRPAFRPYLGVTMKAIPSIKVARVLPAPGSREQATTPRCCPGLNLCEAFPSDPGQGKLSAGERL